MLWARMLAYVTGMVNQELLFRKEYISGGQRTGSSVDGVALSGDGRIAVSASDDQTATVWELDAGRLLATFTCDDEAYCCSIQLAHARPDAERLMALRI
jgi:hypothetical protein